MKRLEEVVVAAKDAATAANNQALSLWLVLPLTL